MPRETIYLRDPEGQKLVKGTWKYARGYVPGQPNEGLVEQIEGSPARLADYDDSAETRTLVRTLVRVTLLGADTCRRRGGLSVDGMSA